MSSKNILVTGSTGLVGSAVCVHFHRLGYRVTGLDNNQRKVFFGPDGDTSANLDWLRANLPGYRHEEVDVRNRSRLQQVIKGGRFNLFVHAAGQPSHDLAATIPFDDFETNALGTLNLLEAVREYAKDAPFIFLSTNKVYGDRPNSLKLLEAETRWEYADSLFSKGIPETMSIDDSTHSLFGVSKVAADLMVQEYGRYFGMPTCCLRAGCLTGAAQSGVKLHGFLNYLVRCAVLEGEYTIIGYKGKQVRDNLEASDVGSFIECFANAPRSAAVYNIGGGHANSCSILEAIALIESKIHKKVLTKYEAQARVGDHICYYSDLSRIQKDYPNWTVRKKLPQILDEMIVRYTS